VKKSKLKQCPFDKASTCIQEETCVGCETLGEYFANKPSEAEINKIVGDTLLVALKEDKDSIDLVSKAIYKRVRG